MCMTVELVVPQMCDPQHPEGGAEEDGQKSAEAIVFGGGSAQTRMDSLVQNRPIAVRKQGHGNDRQRP